MYKAGGRREEAELLWRSIAPHVRRFPERAPEWVIAAVGQRRGVRLARGRRDRARALRPARAVRRAARDRAGRDAVRRPGRPGARAAGRDVRRPRPGPHPPAAALRAVRGDARHARARRSCSPSSATLGDAAAPTAPVRSRRGSVWIRCSPVARSGRRRARSPAARREIAALVADGLSNAAIACAADPVGAHGREPRQRAPQARPDLAPASPPGTSRRGRGSRRPPSSAPARRVQRTLATAPSLQ